MTTRRQFLTATAGAICLPLTGFRPKRDAWDVVEEAQRLHGAETTLTPIRKLCIPGCTKHTSYDGWSNGVFETCNVTRHGQEICVHRFRSTGWNPSELFLSVLAGVVIADKGFYLWAWHQRIDGSVSVIVPTKSGSVHYSFRPDCLLPDSRKFIKYNQAPHIAGPNQVPPSPG